MSEVRRYQQRGVDGYSLPLDVIPGEPEPLTYKIKYPFAQDALNANVQEVAANGDNFDNRSSLQWRYLAAQQSVPAVVAAELAASQGGLPPTAIGIAAAGMAVATWFNRRKDSKQLDEQHTQTYFDTQMVGQEYELYRPVGHSDATDQDRSVDLVWYGPLVDSERLWNKRDNLVQMATLAKEAGVTTMYVDWGARKDVKFSHTHEQITSAAELVYGQKRIPAESFNKYLIGKSPDEWLQIPPEVPETQEAYDPATKKQLLADKLRAVNPSNPLARALEKGEFLSAEQCNDPSIVNPIKKAATIALNRHLERQTYNSEILAERVARASTNTFITKDDQVVAEKGRISTRFDKDTGKPKDAVVWQTHYGPTTQDTLTALELTEEEYTRYINMPAEAIAECIDKQGFDNPDKVTMALELAAFRLAYGGSAAMASEVTQAEKRYFGSGYGPELTIQDALRLAKDKETRRSYKGVINLTRHRLLQYGVGIVATSVLAVGLAGIHQKLNSLNDRAVEKARYELAAKRRVTPETISSQDAQDLANARSAKATAYSSWMKGANTIAGAWPDVPTFFTDPETVAKDPHASVSRRNAEIGNVTHDGKDTNQFHIEAVNGAKAEGFWYTSTSSDLTVDIDQSGKLMPPTWEFPKNADMITEGNFPTKLSKEYSAKPYLEVSRELAGPTVKDGVMSYEDADNNNPLGTGAFLIPVLEHTKPVAAELDGKRVELARVEGNTYAVSTLDPNRGFNGPDIAGKLTYWLVPDKKAPMPEAKNHIAINRLDGNDDALGPKFKKLKDQLEEVEFGAEISSDNGAKAARISREWRYSLDPFTKEQENSWKTLDDMIADAEKNKLANCNIANTDANLSDTATNQVFGYLNGVGSGVTELSAFELHQKTIRRDATPAILAPAPAEAKSNGSLNLPYGTILGIGAGILLAASQRRRLARLPKKALEAQYVRAQRKDNEQNAQAEYVFAGHSDDDYITAAAVAEHVAYAGRPLTQAVLQQSKGRISSSTTGARSQAVLGRPHLTGQDMVEYLGETADYVELKDATLANQLRKSAGVLADGANVLAMRNGEVSTQNVDRFNQRMARLKRLGRKALFLKK